MSASTHISACISQAVAVEVMEGRGNAADALPSPPPLPPPSVSPAHSPLPTPPPPSSPLAPPPTPSPVPGATICEFISGPVAPAQLSHRISHAQTVNDNSVGAHHISEFSTILLLQVHAARRARRPIPPIPAAKTTEKPLNLSAHQLWWIYKYIFAFFCAIPNQMSSNTNC